MEETATPGRRTGPETSLQPPRPTRDLVGRPRLEARLGPDTGAAWSLVVGPPGSGKSTLVRSWLESRREPWAWLRMDTDRRVRPDIVELLIKAVQSTRPDSPLDVLDELAMGDVDDAALLATLVASIDDAEAPPGIVVVDDVHQLGSEEWVHLRRLLEHLPTGLHVVIVGRADPTMPLGRDRANGRMTEIRAHELEFELDETLELIHTHHPDVPVTVARELHARTEGWVAGLRLALLAARDRDLREVVSQFDGTHRGVAELLLEEVLDHQPPDVRGFLLDTSVLDVLEPALCDALTERLDAAKILQRLARDGVFVTTIDGPSPRYRFHPLLAELLRHEHQRVDPARVEKVRGRAAEWFIAAHRPIEAIDHLIAIGEHRAAHTLVLEHFDLLYVGRHRRDLARWLVAVPDEVILSSIDLTVEHCRALALLAHEEANRWYLHCDERVGDDDALRARLMAVNALHRAINSRLDEMRAWRDEARARSGPGPDDPVHEVLDSWEVRLEARLGDPVRAVELGRTLAGTRRVLLHDAPALSVLAGALAAAGMTEQAELVAQQALRRWRDDGEPELPGVIDALAVAAGAARRAGDLDTAEELVAIALALSPRGARAHLLSSIPLLEQARIDHARGRPGWREDLVVLAEDLRMIGTPEPAVAPVDAALAELIAAAPSPSSTDRAGEPSPDPLVEPLTERELSVLAFLSGHLTFPEIGEELYISRHTVKTHAVRIYRKLDVSSRSSAVREARRRGLLD